MKLRPHDQQHLRVTALPVLGDLEDIELGVEAELCRRSRRTRLASAIEGAILLPGICAAEQAAAGHAS